MENNDEDKDIALEENNEELDLDLEEEPEEESNDPLDRIEDLDELRKRAKGYRAQATRKKIDPKPLQVKAKAPDEDIRSKVELLELAEKKRQFGYEHGLSPEQTDRVFRVNPNPSADDLKDPFIKAGLEALKKKSSLEANVPSSSARVSPTIEKDFETLNPNEKQAKYEKYMAEKMKKRG